MAEFQYKIVTPQGKEKKGTMEARTKDQVTTML